MHHLELIISAIDQCSVEPAMVQCASTSQGRIVSAFATPALPRRIACLPPPRAAGRRRGAPARVVSTMVRAPPGGLYRVYIWYIYMYSYSRSSTILYHTGLKKFEYNKF